MPTQITLNTELSREKLLELRDEIDALLGGAPAPVSTKTTTTSAPPSTSARSTGAIDPLAITPHGRLNPNLEGLVRHIVKNYGDRQFAWTDVAASMGRSVGTVKSWHRSLSKPLNRLASANPSAPRLLRDGWNGTKQRLVSMYWPSLQRLNRSMCWL